MHSRLLSTLALAALAACGGDDEDTSRMAAAADSMLRPDTAVAGGDVAATTMSAPAILSMLGTTNGAEIQAGETAVEKARSAEVRAFARTMVRDHQAMQREVDAAAKAANLTPAAPPQADAMRDTHQRHADSLQALSGDAFDRAYMASQVAMHERTLQDLRSWQSAAIDAQLRTVITNAIPKVEQHLTRAREIQGGLGSR